MPCAWVSNQASSRKGFKRMRFLNDGFETAVLKKRLQQLGATAGQHAAGTSTRWFSCE